MELTTAVELLETGIKTSGPEQWADLGAGKGFFSLALSQLLYPGSKILAVDKIQDSIASVKSTRSDVEIDKLVADFQKMPFEAKFYDGVLMANSFHFVKNKTALILKIQKAIKPGGRLILVEYDLDIPNQWVPFPVSFHSLNQLLHEISLKATHLGETPSVYQRANIYSAMINF